MNKNIATSNTNRASEEKANDNSRAINALRIVKAIDKCYNHVEVIIPKGKALKKTTLIPAKANDLKLLLAEQNRLSPRKKR